MSVNDLSSSTQNYLKSVWGLEEWSAEPVTPKMLADRMGLKLSSVSDGVKKLSGQGLLQHAPYGAIRLTADGRAYAVEMVRRHRLIETFLVQILGYGWEEVHNEADALEHVVSDMMIERIDVLLGHPERDPHGDPIPRPDGSLKSLKAVPLSEAHLDREVIIERIADDDPELLTFFEQRGLLVGARMLVLPGEPFSESVVVQIHGEGDAQSNAHVMGRVPMSSVFVSFA